LAPYVLVYGPFGLELGFPPPFVVPVDIVRVFVPVTTLVVGVPGPSLVFTGPGFIIRPPFFAPTFPVRDQPALMAAFRAGAEGLDGGTAGIRRKPTTAMLTTFLENSLGMTLLP